MWPLKYTIAHFILYLQLWTFMYFQPDSQYVTNYTFIFIAQSALQTISTQQRINLCYIS